MTYISRDNALELLRGGKDGVAEWNRRRDQGDTIPNLGGADLTGVRLSGSLLAVVEVVGSCAVQRPGCLDGETHGPFLRGGGWVES